MKKIQEIFVELSAFKYQPSIFYTLQNYVIEAEQALKGIEAQNIIASGRRHVQSEVLTDDVSNSYNRIIAQGEIDKIDASAKVASIQFSRISTRLERLQLMLESLGTVNVDYETAFILELGVFNLPPPPFAKLLDIASGQNKLVTDWSETFIEDLRNEQSSTKTPTVE